MTLQQIRSICEVVAQDLNLSKAARALHTSQPAISKMIRALEAELGIEILVRNGPRIVAITEQARGIIQFANRVLRATEDLRLAAADAKDAATGVLRIATTHMHARHSLVHAIKEFALKYPKVDVDMVVGTRQEIVGWIVAGDADIGFGNMPDHLPSSLCKLETSLIKPCVIVPRGHPLLKKRPLTLSKIGEYQLIISHSRSEIASPIDQTFLTSGITRKIRMRAPSFEAVKTYVAAGLGIAVIHEMALDPHDVSIVAMNVDHLFPSQANCMLLRRDHYLRNFMYDFMAMISPQWAAAKVRAKQGGRRDRGRSAPEPIA